MMTPERRRVERIVGYTLMGGAMLGFYFGFKTLISDVEQQYGEDPSILNAFSYMQDLGGDMRSGEIMDDPTALTAVYEVGGGVIGLIGSSTLLHKARTNP